MVCPTAPGGLVFQWFAQRVCGVGVGFFFNGPPNGPGRGFGFFFQSGPGGFVFQWFAQRVCGVGVGFFKYWFAQRAREGFRIFFQWSAQQAREGFRIFVFNGSPNGLGGIRF